VLDSGHRKASKSSLACLLTSWGHLLTPRFAGLVVGQQWYNAAPLLAQWIRPCDCRHDCLANRYEWLFLIQSRYKWARCEDKSQSSVPPLSSIMHQTAQHHRQQHWQGQQTYCLLQRHNHDTSVWHLLLVATSSEIRVKYQLVGVARSKFDSRLSNHNKL